MTPRSIVLSVLQLGAILALLVWVGWMHVDYWRADHRGLALQYAAGRATGLVAFADTAAEAAAPPADPSPEGQAKTEAALLTLRDGGRSGCEWWRLDECLYLRGPAALLDHPDRLAAAFDAARRPCHYLPTLDDIAASPVLDSVGRERLLSYLDLMRCTTSPEEFPGKVVIKLVDGRGHTVLLTTKSRRAEPEGRAAQGSLPPPLPPQPAAPPPVSPQPVAPPPVAPPAAPDPSSALPTPPVDKAALPVPGEKPAPPHPAKPARTAPGRHASQ